MINFFKSGTAERQKPAKETPDSPEGVQRLGSRELLEKEYSDVAEMANEVLVIIQLNRFNHLNTIFGMEMIETIVKILSGLIADYAERSGGKAYSLQMDLIAVITPYGERDTFLAGLQEQVKKMEEVNFRDEDIVYSNHYTFTYIVYFLDFDKSYIPDIKIILDNMLLKLKQIGNGNSTRGEVYNGAGDPNWRLLDSLSREVKRGWENREFIPYYQLIYELKTGTPVGAELLTRWNHPERGILTPNEFLSVLEKQGLILNLDLYMLKEACKKIKNWIEEELVTVPITVNVSKLNLHREDFLPKVLDIVKRYDIPGVLLILEIEESIIVTELDSELIHTINELRDYGIQISMDKFAATEYSSLNVLRYVPIDMIKVNPSFFPGGDADRREKIFVRNVFRMLRDLGIRAVAERAETMEDITKFEKYGCECAQGFYYSKPMCDEEFEKIIF